MASTQILLWVMDGFLILWVAFWLVLFVRTIWVKIQQAIRAEEQGNFLLAYVIREKMIAATKGTATMLLGAVLCGMWVHGCAR